MRTRVRGPARIETPIPITILPLEKRWNVYLHPLYDNDWGKDSYHKSVSVSTVHEAASFITVFSDKLDACMLYCMVDTCHPDVSTHSPNSGYISYVFQDNNIACITSIIFSLFGGTYSQDASFNQHIVGWSCCFKGYRSIFKVWVDDIATIPPQTTLHKTKKIAVIINNHPKY